MRIHLVLCSLHTIDNVVRSYAMLSIASIAAALANRHICDADGDNDAHRHRHRPLL